MSGPQSPEDLIHEVVGLAMKVHRKLGPGYLESVYQNALLVELKARAGFSTSCQHPLSVIYEGVVVGDFTADLLINDRLLIELKAARAIDAVHEAQLMNYLKATGLEHGLLLNFGAASLQFRSKSRSFRRQSDDSTSLLSP